ncbi:expressed unknown protein [Seminavis robusta]|uniref:Uncharacterized protein n=1 Tax=Seminavis robusta TaxID=568900 RepID=A0A9N8DNU0_9STRA|nr:expressed unknown protein [Seminavis robusta]|eukprot:Sro265_g102960.1 n/a (137) ;mRNA; r:79223-79633
MPLLLRISCPPEFVEIHGGVSSGMAQQTLAHLLLSPMRMVCLGIAPQLRQNDVLLNDEGMPAYTSWLLCTISWLRDSMPGLVQATVLTIVVLLLGPVTILEGLMGPCFAPWVIAGMMAMWFVAAAKKNHNAGKNYV